MNLILIGYRATGKTTVARLLAERLGWEWHDVDPEIEREAGKPIDRIFAEDGEPHFRDIESRVLARLCDGEHRIVACGGGTPLRPQNQEVIRKTGKTVWLTATPETIHRRMTQDPLSAQRRPNLTNVGGLQEVIDLLEKRSPVYRKLADWIVDTENRTPEEITEEILEHFRPFVER
ncbi:MAG: shikimate kinase [Planctomycetota bacterium]|nr:MAG: shikimate kinase [Planctomycetota bacterium]